MRVIAGDYKGRPLASVPGRGTRPTTDKVKESIFNIIGPYFDGGWALDLYAGTGGLGIEALSRGADKAIFVDADPKAVSIVKQNLAALKLEGRAEVYRIDAARALRALAKRQLVFDLVFLDPPYAKQQIALELQVLQEAGLLSSECRVVAEHDAGVILPERVGDCSVQRSASYGDTAVTIYGF
ncbi:16S rRNA (guanine(966)-N(2))-methyltransferase RsmD [Brevibacillus massiliensis]|jgi:16S rRNA (guanine(966)-N(2))-methyltransferase RsmD|uniref:16S rRNA (guanine(966)-N(2))-methyltransferase RsmD n=1 Tax=Brevibacillus massiliensis TaxID=1118054 RepID=UPI0003067F65|nr:16S rRNA (guanine(966)-N(2))-methyltransferase RsmD [Brevibacillus massiliensis]